MDEVMLKELVLSFLPGLSDETLTSLLNGLQELGVENKEDLALVQEKDIVKYIRPIQCRKLLHGFKGIFSHFTLLTDVPILMKLRKALDKNYNTILKFFQGVNYQGVKDVLATFEPEASDKTAIVLLLLMAYFKEPKDSIVLDVDESIFSLSN
ncbi:hypothetical protein HF521_011874 [Silurus meridionalis]|uniref:Uncharacterized protein n=1 Tax=Silurus meridionalis TaxID=175797 RepID=A0A8T0AD86_SILME|nr:hypothetical protein HF521_011874 [Silurus meridionalis]